MNCKDNSGNPCRIISNARQWFYFDPSPALVKLISITLILLLGSEKSDPISVALRTLPPLLYGDDQAYGILFTSSGDTLAGVKALINQSLTA